MKVLMHFSPEALSNSYIVSPDNGNDALLVDPKSFDLGYFELLESRNLNVAGVLLTHGDTRSAHAVRTLRKVYHFRTYGGDDVLEDIKLVNIKSVTHFRAKDMLIGSYFLPGHFLDSIVYQIGDYVFPGDLFSAGLVTDADGAYGRALLVQCIKETILELPDHTLILPASGPPTMVGIERETNMDLKLNLELST